MKFYETIAYVLGGSIEMIETMTGAILFKTSKDGLYIKDIKASKKVKNIHVVYNEGADLINIFFMDKDYKETKVVRDIYIDQVKDIIEKTTGIYFSLY